MKQRSADRPTKHGPEFKGVVKTITGKLTSNSGLEREGRQEMLAGRRRATAAKAKAGPPLNLNPDPHRRG